MNEWQPIETCPDNEDVFFAAYIVPSDEAALHGSRPFWNYGSGRKICTQSIYTKPLYTGILGGKPSHWMLSKPPFTTNPKVEKTEEL